MTPKEFRAELTKIMPGYSWTVHKSSTDDYMEATGTQSSGFNRLSTLVVVRRDNYAGKGNDRPWYTVKSAGFGLRAPFLGAYEDGTLARALRGLQKHYEHMAGTYAGHARALQSARQPKKEPA
ncbi:hypothetical protein C7441_11044 [Pseudaminobacter salicylatoxidans]|uniref:Uncharacterized protein n=1 Tax=Pseudaminobacter salicylatoxidans TaxID=93369 RepID=A0A316C0J2_PSESE|nr:hypothetical protein [Pseudaminobacter salicylatoxidans]PWJ81512.1 hypothetical protein C7441_11044 [Pseudaminobacter salicylatoxidans]